MRPKELQPKIDQIRKYFSDYGHRELFVFGKQQMGVRRISDYTMAISEKYVRNYFRRPHEEDLVIMRIHRTLRKYDL